MFGKSRNSSSRSKMGLKQRMLVIVPTILTIIGLILSTMSLAAGSSKGVMEEFAIARLNISQLGHDLLSSDSSKNSRGLGDLGDDLKGKLDDAKDDAKKGLDDAKDDAKDGLNKAIGSAVDDAAQALGLPDWFSVHILNACEGEYKPNGTASSPGLNTTDCTNTTPSNDFNITKVLDKHISAGPIDFSLSDLNWPDDIQGAIDMLNDALLGIFIMYVLGLGLAGVALIGCAVAFIKHQSRGISIFNMLASVISMLCLAVGSIIVTVAMITGVDKINDVGNDIGVEAQKGGKFMGLTWASFVAMLLASVFWIWTFWKLHRARKHIRSKEEH